MDIGVPEPPIPGDPLRGSGGSEFCRNRWEKLKISPKLLRPLVDVEVRPDDVKWGEGCWSGSGIESMVDDLSRRFGASRPWFEEVEFAERADATEFLLGEGPGPWEDRPTDERTGDGRGETWSWLRSSEMSDLDATQFCGPLSPESGVGTLGGKGKRGARFLFKRGIRNRLVPVVEPGAWVRWTPRSPWLWSEREDSEKRMSAPDERWESLGWSRPLLRIEFVESRPGSSPMGP